MQRLQTKFTNLNSLSSFATKKANVHRDVLWYTSSNILPDLHRVLFLNDPLQIHFMYFIIPLSHFSCFNSIAHTVIKFEISMILFP